MNERSKKLLDKVYAHLDNIDVSKLSMREMMDFLEVVQKGQFLETLGPVPSFGFGCRPFSQPHAYIPPGDEKE